MGLKKRIGNTTRELTRRVSKGLGKTLSFRKSLVSMRNRKFLVPGKQTQITLAVQFFADRFPKERNLETVKAIVQGIVVFFPRRGFNFEQIKSIYSKRTASQIIESGFIPVKKGVSLEELEMLETEADISGCIDYNVLLCAILRAKGIPAKFVRIKKHSVTHFFLDGKWYEADPIARMGEIAHRFKDSKAVSEITPEQEKAYKILKAEGKLGEGLDAWGVGITGVEDFTKYHV